MDNNNCNGIIDILKLIDRLQRNAKDDDLIDNTCSRPFLGNIAIGSFYNTRPVNFFTCNGDILSISYYVNGVLNTTSVFRIENVDDDFVTVRLLQDIDGTYTNTGETATINTDCICALKCLDDIVLNL